MPRFVEVLIQHARANAPYKNLDSVRGKFDDVERRGRGGVPVMETRQGTILFDMGDPANPVLVTDDPPDAGTVDALNYLAARL